MSYRIHTDLSWQDTLADLRVMFERWGVGPKDWTAIKPRQTRRLRSWAAPEERRVTIEFVHPNGRRITITKDDQDTPEDNLRAIYLALEDLRMIEKRGLRDLVGNALLQIAAPRQRTWRDVLGLDPGVDWRRGDIEHAYRAKAREAHPDAGGSPEAFVELQRAYAAAIAELEGQ